MAPRVDVELRPAGIFRELRDRADPDEALGRRHLEVLGGQLDSLLRGLAPVGPTGNYRSRIGHKVTGGGDNLAVESGSRAHHRHLVEKGRTAGKMPPPRLIAKLFGIPVGEAFLVARAIGRRGTRGYHVVRRATPTARSHARRMLAAYAADMASRVTDG